MRLGAPKSKSALRCKKMKKEKKCEHKRSKYVNEIEIDTDKESERDS